MRMVRPKLKAPQVQIAERQHEFREVTGAYVRHPDYGARPVLVKRDKPEDPDVVEVNSVVVAFKPSDEERARIAAGEDVYLSLLTFCDPMQGVLLTVGAQDTVAIYGIEVEE